jgi:hypothetical protein
MQRDWENLSATCEYPVCASPIYARFTVLCWRMANSVSRVGKRTSCLVITLLTILLTIFLLLSFLHYSPLSKELLDGMKSDLK